MLSWQLGSGSISGMGALPSGTVSFLFTDIEGSTRLWDRSPDAMAEALGRHDGVLRRAIEDHGGAIFSTGGDGFAAAFARARDALGAAVDAQVRLSRENWPDGVELRVRMGLDTGEAEERDGNYFGPPLNRAARLMGAAAGGTILSSGTTAALVGESPPGVNLVALGERLLRGLTDPVSVFGVRIDGLTWADMSDANRKVNGNLPRPRTDYVGQAIDLKVLAGELTRHRLITLTGPGGVGKTRMAIEAAWLEEQEFPLGVWLVDLGSLADGSGVLHAFVSALGARADRSMTLEDAVAEALVGRHLVVVDNCEHVLEPVSRMIGQILDRCPAVTVLATSREPIGMAGEKVWPVRSLEPGSEAQQLFCSRAQAADSRIDYSDSDLELISRICARLDGIPLAIELAAARSRSLAPEDVLKRLDDRFRLLKGGPRGAVERHQTLQTAVSWSYRLLSSEERLLFDRLSVFAGSFDLTAAEGICSGSGLEAADVIELLAALVDKSMVNVERAPRHTRYRLLETLRSFAEHRIEERGESVELGDKHLEHYLGVAAQAMTESLGSEPFPAFKKFEAEWDNFRAALSWSIASGRPDLGALLCTCLGGFSISSLRLEARDWMDQTLAALDVGDPSRALLLGLSGYITAMATGDQEAAIDRGREGLRLAQDAFSRATCFGLLAAAYVNSGRGEEALDAITQATALCEHDNPEGLVMALHILVWVSWAVDPEGVAAHAERERAVAAAMGSRMWQATAEGSAGFAALIAGKPEEALDRFYRCMELGGSMPSTRGEALVGIAYAAALLNDEMSAKSFSEAITGLHEMRFWMYIWITLERLATYWVSTARLDDGAVLLGHLVAHSHSHASLLRDRTRALDALSRYSRSEKRMGQGAAMTRDEVVLYSLTKLSSGHSAATAGVS